MDSWNNKKYWNRLASEISNDKQLGRALPDDAPEFIVKWVSEFEKDISTYCLNDHAGLLLDAGCGNANLLMHALNLFPKKNITYVGLDFSKKMLDRGIAQVRNNSNALLLQGSISKLPFNDNVFDRIVCNGVITCLESVEELKETLKEFHRVIKPEGIMVIDIFNRFMPKIIAKSIIWNRISPRSTKYISPIWIKKRLKVTKFDILSYRGYDFRPTAGYMTYRSIFKFLNPGFFQEKISTFIERELVPRMPFLNLFGSRIYIKCKALK